MQYRPVRAVTIVRAASAATRIPLEYKLTAWRNIRGTEAVAAAASGDTTVASIAEKLADEVERTDPTVHAFLDFDRPRLLGAAAALDQRPRARHGPLHGLAIAVKEVFDVTSHRCCWGLPSLHDRIATRDARPEIGNALCRERVCQNSEIS